MQNHDRIDNYRFSLAMKLLGLAMLVTVALNFLPWLQAVFVLGIIALGSLVYILKIHGIRRSLEMLRYHTVTAIAWCVAGYYWLEEFIGGKDLFPDRSQDDAEHN